MFPEVPCDRGHLALPYVPHLLRGLCTELPPYVQAVRAGQQPQRSVIDHVGGIMAVQC
jgi:hypothetical protein